MYALLPAINCVPRNASPFSQLGSRPGAGAGRRSPHSQLERRGCTVFDKTTFSPTFKVAAEFVTRLPHDEDAARKQASKDAGRAEGAFNGRN